MDANAPTYTIEAALPAGSPADAVTLQRYVSGMPYGPPQAFEGSSATSGIADSADVVKLVNGHVDRYGLNVVWLFGHNHSQGENEFCKFPGA